MEKREFKIGDKVKILKTKSTGLNINDSTLKILFSEEKHDYLIVRRITNLFPNSSEKIVECMFPTSKMCTQFLNTDLEHYEEEFVLPECWFVLYNTREEFDIINKFCGKNWIYSDSKDKCGYHNNGDDQINSGNWVGSVKSAKEKLLEKGYVQITFEQFQKYVLKQETMEKEIIGYKLIKPEYEGAAAKLIYNGDKIHGLVQVNSEWNILKEAGVLDLWFEPVFKEEKTFKVGDWVSFYSEVRSKIITSQIKDWTAHSYCKLKNGLEPFKHLIRKATLEEIKNASEVLLVLSNNKKVIIELNKITASNREIDIKDIKKLMEPLGTLGNSYWNINIESIKIGCWENVTRKDLKLIIDTYEEIND